MFIFKIYTIIAGVNGVGKSSFIGVLKTQRNDLGYIIDIDKFAKDNSLTALNAGKTAVLKIKNSIENGVSFSQETTLSGCKTLRNIKKAKGNGYFIRLYYIGLDNYNESVIRVENRVRKGGHNIKEEDIKRRFQKRFEDLLKIIPFCDEALFIDNENGFGEVAEYKNGELILKGDYSPDWIRKLKEKLV